MSYDPYLHAAYLEMGPPQFNGGDCPWLKAVYRPLTQDTLLDLVMTRVSCVFYFGPRFGRRDQGLQPDVTKLPSMTGEELQKRATTMRGTHGDGGSLRDTCWITYMAMCRREYGWRNPAAWTLDTEATSACAMSVYEHQARLRADRLRLSHPSPAAIAGYVRQLQQVFGVTPPPPPPQTPPKTRKKR
jgi:hypothetical protein